MKVVYQRGLESSRVVGGRERQVEWQHDRGQNGVARTVAYQPFEKGLCRWLRDHGVHPGRLPICDSLTEEVIERVSYKHAAILEFGKIATQSLVQRRAMNEEVERAAQPEPRTRRRVKVFDGRVDGAGDGNGIVVVLFGRLAFRSRVFDNGKCPHEQAMGVFGLAMSDCVSELTVDSTHHPEYDAEHHEDVLGYCSREARHRHPDGNKDFLF